MPFKTIFLDRDGVINKEIGYLHKIEDFIFIDGVIETCRILNTLGYQIIIITNQSGIGRGYYSTKDFNQLTHWMLKKFLDNDVIIKDVFFCPHSPDDLCKCRKPLPGMIKEAIEKHDVDIANSWSIGDKEDDISAAKDSNIANTVLVRSGHSIEETKTEADYVIDSLKDLINILKN